MTEGADKKSRPTRKSWEIPHHVRTPAARKRDIIMVDIGSWFTKRCQAYVEASETGNDGHHRQAEPPALPPQTHVLRTVEGQTEQETTAQAKQQQQLRLKSRVHDGTISPSPSACSYSYVFTKNKTPVQRRCALCGTACRRSFYCILFLRQKSNQTINNG